MFEEGRSPTESFDSILKMARLCGAFVGMDVSSPNFRLNWVNSMVISIITGYLIFTVTTIMNVYEENPTIVLEASCMMGSVMQGITKLMTGFAYTKSFVALRYELEDMYKEYEQKGSKFRMVLNRSCKRVRKVIKLFGWIYLYVATGLMCVPIGIFLITKRRLLIMHFLLPGLDVETEFGYFITTAAHSACVYIGIFGLFTGDMFVVIYLLQSLLFADIFGLKIQELNTCLENSTEVRKQRILLRDIICWHKKYNEFNTNCNTIFYYIITVQITTAGISILCTLFVLLTSEWPGGYAYILLPLTSLYSYCMLGTKIEDCNDRFTCEIFDINWFMLLQKEQELVGFMLMKSQNPITIDVAGIMPLTVRTALQITKTIYSIFMMMVQMLVN